jgi:hypothetical protein
VRPAPSRLLAILLVAAISLRAFSQESPAAAAAQAAPAAPAAGALPSGFRKASSENPWRRFEIIAFGAFPIMLFYVNFSFDIGNFLSNDFDRRYAPWPFKGDNAVDPDEGEYLLRLAVATGASLAFSAADALIRSIRFRAAAAPGAAAPADAGAAPDPAARALPLEPAPNLTAP